jgi:RNA polymerase sigma-70 factor (ECF subfamily)
MEAAAAMEAIERVAASRARRAELAAHCRHILGASADAEDAVQETLLRAWRAAGCFENRSSLTTWLYRIATNVCLDLRARTARGPTPVEELPQPLDAYGDRWTEPDPCDCALAAERLRLAVLATIATLPPRQRAVLMLRDVLSWHASEVAALLGTTVPAVNSALQRAHAVLIGIDPDATADAGGTANRELASRYLTAFARDDIDGLVALAAAA